MSLGTFAVISMLERSENTVLGVEDLAGMSRRHPILSLCLTVFLLSLAGVPPTLGFFGKFYLFNAAIGEGLLWLAIWGVINSVIGVYYYLRPIVVMYMKDGHAEMAKHSLNATTVTVIVMALIVTLLGVLSGPLFSAVEKSLL